MTEHAREEQPEIAVFEPEVLQQLAAQAAEFHELYGRLQHRLPVVSPGIVTELGVTPRYTRSATDSVVVLAPEAWRPTCQITTEKVVSDLGGRSLLCAETLVLDAHKIPDHQYRSQLSVLRAEVPLDGQQVVPSERWRQLGCRPVYEAIPLSRPMLTKMQRYLNEGQEFFRSKLTAEELF